MVIAFSFILVPIAFFGVWIFHEQVVFYSEFEWIVSLIAGLLGCFMIVMMFYGLFRIFSMFKVNSIKENLSAILTMLIFSVMIGYVWFYGDYIKKKREFNYKGRSTV